MGIPYEVVVAAYLVAAFILLFAWLMAGAAVRRRVLGLAVVLVASPFAMITLGAPLRPDEQPLATGDAWGGEDPALLQIVDVDDGRSQLPRAVSRADRPAAPGTRDSRADLPVATIQDR